MSASATAAPRDPRYLAGPGGALRLSATSALLVVAFGLSLMLVNLGGNRVLTYHEVVISQPAREMVATGNWIVPTMAGVPYTDKPPLGAWLIAASITLFGSHGEWVVRLPAVLSAVLTSLLVAGLAARWFGNRIGLVAGLAQVTTYYILQLGRLAECDIHFITTVSAAMGCFALANVDSPHGRSQSRWVAPGFYLFAGLAFLAKGPLGLFFIFSGCLLFLAVNQDLRGLRFFFNPLGLALFLLCLFAWPLAAYAMHPPILDAWITHNLGRFHGQLGGQKSAMYYLYHVPLVMMPWFPFAALAFVRAARDGRLLAPLWKFTLCWMMPGLVLLCASTFKSKHYAAPLLPGMTIAAALGLVEYFQWRRKSETTSRIWLTVATLVGCTAGVLAVSYAAPAGGAAICWLVVLLGICCLMLLYLESRRQLNAQLAVVFATAWLAVAGVHTFVMPHHDTYRDQTTLARRINKQLPRDERLFMVALPDTQITYYLEPSLDRLDDQQVFFNRLPLAETATYHVLAPEHLGKPLGEFGQVKVLDRCDSIIRWMQPEERLTLFELKRTESVAAKSEHKRL